MSFKSFFPQRPAEAAWAALPAVLLECQGACVLRGEKPLPAIAPCFLWLLSCWGLGSPEPSSH